VTRLAVIGGDAGGASAASQARRRKKREELDIVVFERGDYTSYSACGLPYLVAGSVDDEDVLIARSPEEHRAHGIDVRMRHRVVAIDVAGRTLAVRNLETNEERTEPFDQLVIATGATPIRPPLPGVDAHGIHGIQTITDGVALRNHLVEDLEQGDHAVVVGSGYVGLEMAEAMRDRGFKVTVIESGPQPMQSLDPDMGARVADAMRGIGIDLRTNTSATGFDTGSDGHVTAVVTDAGTLPAAAVVLGVGVHPNARLAREAGIATGEFGGVSVDAHQATNVEDIYAAGDCIETYHRVTHRPAFIPLGTHANKQGRVAGVNASGGRATFPGVVGTAITKVCAYEIGRTGVNEQEATDAGFDFVTATIESTTRAGYYPGAQPIVVKVLAERRTGRLLGAQIIGREGAAKRIDVLATAIWAEMSVDEVTQLDLGYAPPFSPVWDPALVAARQVAPRV
jgi:NADPH-dependent 2,4-dienoyl-CoA reductase/sulfur reductase-like enzyme